MKDYGYGNYPEHYEELTNDEREQMALWIRERLELDDRIRPRDRLNSYGLKHLMEREIDLYVTNGQFKGGMEAAGYEAFDTDDINWTYQVKVRKDGR